MLTTKRGRRRRVVRWGAPLAALTVWVAAACAGSPAAPERAAGVPDVSLEFGVHHPQHMLWRGLERLDGAVVVREEFEVFCWPYAADPAVHREDATLVLRLTGHPVEGCPQDMAFSVSYRATIRVEGDMPSQVRVEHRWSDMPERRYERSYP